jgi:hypothetical protein
MSHRPRSIPVGILVSVSDSPRRRRRFKSLEEYPSIKKEVNLPLRIGVGVLVASLAVSVIGGVAYCGARQLSASAPNFVRVEHPVGHFKQQAKVIAPIGAAPAPAVTMPQAPAGLAAAAPGHDDGLAAIIAEVVAKKVPPLEPEPPACTNLGSALTFFSHPPDAFRKAARENKLVLMVHLSGNFEEQAFT